MKQDGRILFNHFLGAGAGAGAGSASASALYPLVEAQAQKSR